MIYISGIYCILKNIYTLLNHCVLHLKLNNITNQVYFTSKKNASESSHHGSVEMNLNTIHEVTGLIPDLAQWVKDPALS